MVYIHENLPVLAENTLWFKHLAQLAGSAMLARFLYVAVYYRGKNVGMS